jgi:hypothetical protein
MDGTAKHHGKLSKPGSERKCCMFSLIYWGCMQKINVYANTNMILHTFICRTCMQLWDCIMGIGGGGREKENHRDWTISKYIAFVKEDIIKKSYWIIGGGRKGQESNKGS